MPASTDDKKKNRPPPSAQMSTPDMSQFANRVDLPQRTGETWGAVAIIVIIAFAIGIFFALR